MKNESYIERLLGEREKIIFVTRQHWFILARAILLEIILILAIFTASILAIILANIGAALVLPIGFILLLIPITTLSLDVARWSSYQFIVTNRRVIQISGIFNKSVTDSSLEKVNDVKMTQSYLGRIFDYGDIEILTASELGVNLFKKIAQPVKFKTAMLNAKEQLDNSSRLEEVQREDIPALIANLDLLRKQGIITEQEFLSKKNELLTRL
jgi:uncharacterized membrane protein YdbT with pleckstrin-like domain